MVRMAVESVERSPMHYQDSGWWLVSAHWHSQRLAPAGSHAKSDSVFDWVSAIIASMFGANEAIEEILEEE